MSTLVAEFPAHCTSLFVNAVIRFPYGRKAFFFFFFFFLFFFFSLLFLLHYVTEQLIKLGMNINCECKQ